MSKRKEQPKQTNGVAIIVVTAVLWVSSFWLMFYLFTALPKWTGIPLVVTELVLTMLAYFFIIFGISKTE